MGKAVSAGLSFNPTWVIQKKRDGFELTSKEIHHFISGLLSGEVADYQASAFLMAVYFKGLSLSETLCLTQAMVESGERYDLSHIPGIKVDKHSTGGVGDKVSIILAPLAAACGLKVPMMAGRGLGSTGGTIDKLESIEGFNVNLRHEEFETVLRKTGCVIVGQTDRIAPADKKLYALRDVTGTVECISLIAPSILSKKIAEGAEALVLDLKVGSGAVMKTKTQAQKLARVILHITKKMNMPCRVVISDMNQPLGYSVGNRLEIKESIEVLQNKKSANTCSSDLRELTLHLCAHMLVLARLVKNPAEGRKLAALRLREGAAWTTFKEMVRAQTNGRDPVGVLDLGRMEFAPQIVIWKAPKSGFLTKMNAEMIGKILVELGGGRKRAADRIDLGVGLTFHKKLGQAFKAGETLVTVYGKLGADLKPLERLFWDSIEFGPTRKPVPKLILEVL